MSLDALWKLPDEAIYFDDQAKSWMVMATRGLGETRAVFIPLTRNGAGWKVALAPHDHIDLSKLPSGTWTQVPLTPGQPDWAYLCAIRYDLPSSHPDDSYVVRSNGQPAVVPGAPPPSRLSGAELEKIFGRLALRYPDRIDNDVVFAGELQQPAGGTPQPGAPSGSDSDSGNVPARASASRSSAPGPGTGPTGTPQELTFAFGSCQYPAGMLDRAVAQSSYRALARYIKQPGVRTPERLLLLGDQVYTDATYGLLDPARLDDRYRMPYEDLRDRDNGPFSALPQQFLSRVRTTPDDHEFVDNWEPWAPSVQSPRFSMGLAAFWEHQRRQPGVNRTGVEHEELHDGWRLFMTDTRTERDYRSADTIQRAGIMSARQMTALETFLTRQPAIDLKIVTSAPMLLPRSREYIDEPLYLDNWQGYPASFHHLLGFLCEHQVDNVVFLSGDAHLACTADVTVRDLDSGKSVEFLSHHAPALYAPYPFANETRWNLLLEDMFQFTTMSGGQRRTYECTVLTTLIDEGHDGCGLMTASRNGNAWSTKVDVVR